ncbi:MAG: hypothetical protein DHS20C08_24250 [Rhodomicrobium sp.]|nr:MAG: hypothetical protein DHS20C08_24250 [Rhodomicrobium sp.]
MKSGELLTLILILWITIPIVAAIIATYKKRDRNFWVIATALFPPLILFLPFLSRRAKPPSKMLGDETHNDDGFFATRD